ncbi:MAG: hypothetical protein U9O63_01290 [Actinomycetota bacterium]|nr:hypothetical protein [Actinomycetota bacterium]
MDTNYSPLDQRHARWLRRFSRCLDLHEGQYRILLDGMDSRNLALHLSDRFGLARPIVKPHRGRKPNTGRCEPSRRQLIDAYGEGRVTTSEEHRERRYPEHPVVRFGNPTLLGVVSHEIAHCLVNHADGLNTPGHGRVWVARYDEVARVAEIWTRRSSIGPSGHEQENPVTIPLRADVSLRSGSVPAILE